MAIPKRDDVLAGGEAPQEVQQCLLETGGNNPFGEPNFQLTIAEKTRLFQGGEWHEWPKGSRLQNRGGMLLNENGLPCAPPQDKPIRITVEMRWVARYPSLHGWILQEWFPAHKYGPPEDWSKHKVPGSNLCRLGPYPQFGDYELALPFGWRQAADQEVLDRDSRFSKNPDCPPLHVLRTAIQYAERCREFWHSMSAEARIKAREDHHLMRQALIEKHEHDRRIEIIRDEMSPLFSSSLEAGRWREKLARDGQIKVGHVGN